MYTLVHKLIFIYKCISECINMYIYIYVYIYMYTYVFIYIYHTHRSLVKHSHCWKSH